MCPLNFYPLCQSIHRGAAPVVRTVLAGEGMGQTQVLSETDTLGRQMCGGVVTYTERYAPAPRLIVLGAGHVGRAVAQLGRFLDFAVEVYDTRRECLDPETLPWADVCGQVDYSHLADTLRPTANAYYLVTTSGHESDEQCVRHILTLPFAYVGMLGSRSKSAQLRRRLTEEGISREILARLHAPVGLPIQAQTPEEIAVSIGGELVACRNAGGVSALSQPLLAALSQPDCRGTLLTITCKRGSAPRGAGSKLLLLADGTTVGSIGGGAVEYRAVTFAKEHPGFAVQTYSLAPEGDGGLNMVCGGWVEVCFQPVENHFPCAGGESGL